MRATTDVLLRLSSGCPIPMSPETPLAPHAAEPSVQDRLQQVQPRSLGGLGNERESAQKPNLDPSSSQRRARVIVTFFVGSITAYLCALANALYSPNAPVLVSN